MRRAFPTNGDSIMSLPARWRRGTSPAALAIALALPLVALSGCATVGSVMSPYPEKFSCKNSDHGQCIHPDQAYADAVAGRASKSDPLVTNDPKLLTADQKAGRAKAMPQAPDMDKMIRAAMKRPGKVDLSTATTADTTSTPGPKLGRGNVGALIGADRATAGGTPMLRPSQTLRTLILPYADRQRPDRLYMARYIYSIIDKPAWVVGDYLVEPAGRKPASPVLRSSRDSDAVTGDQPAGDAAAAPLASEPRP
jgi:conjugal transfer pilus assembly protein TraV